MKTAIGMSPTNDNKIPCIIGVRQLTGMGLFAAKVFVEALIASDGNLNVTDIFVLPGDVRSRLKDELLVYRSPQYVEQVLNCFRFRMFPETPEEAEQMVTDMAKR